VFGIASGDDRLDGEGAQQPVRSHSHGHLGALEGVVGDGPVPRIGGMT
jgi:hypothetical protein